MTREDLSEYLTGFCYLCFTASPLIGAIVGPVFFDLWWVAGAGYGIAIALGLLAAFMAVVTVLIAAGSIVGFIVVGLVGLWEKLTKP